MSSLRLFIPCCGSEIETPKAGLCSTAVVHGWIALCIGVIVGIGLCLSLWQTTSLAIFIGFGAGGTALAATYCALRIIYGTLCEGLDLSVSKPHAILERDGSALIQISKNQEIPQIIQLEATVNQKEPSLFPPSWTYGQEGFESLLQQYRTRLSKQLLLKYGMIPSIIDIEQSKEKRILSVIPSYYEWRMRSELWGTRISTRDFIFIIPIPSKIGCSADLTDTAWEEGERLYDSYIEDQIKSRSTLLTNHLMRTFTEENSIPCCLFHGTSSSGAQALLHEGFKDEYKTNYQLTHGLGVYLAMTEKHAKVYAKEEGIVLKIKVKPHAHWATIDHRSWDNWKREVLEPKTKAFLIEELKELESNASSSIPFLIGDSDLYRHLYAALARDILTRDGHNAFYVQQSCSPLSQGDPPPDYIYLSSASLVEFILEQA